jgi:hypothetical protein
MIRVGFQQLHFQAGGCDEGHAAFKLAPEILKALNQRGARYRGGLPGDLRG